MPSSGLPAAGSRQTWPSSSQVRRQPNAASQKEAIRAGSGVSTQTHWMRMSTCRSCVDRQGGVQRFRSRVWCAGSVEGTMLQDRRHEYRHPSSWTFGAVPGEDDLVEYVHFAEAHLPGILRLCELEGWPSFPGDPERAVRALTAPGVVCVVAVQDGEVAGFAQLLTDGEIQAYLCLVAVTTMLRANGIGKKLIEEAFGRSGAERLDLLSADESQGFYRSFLHREVPGYRIYPGAEPTGT